MEKEYVNKKRSAGIVIIYNNKILLIHPASSKRFSKNYSFPKGGVDKGETIIEAALREVREEVGIKLKKSQLDNKMYEIPYVSKGKKSWGKIPKGEIYKTVYYWTCHIKDLKEIGLNSEVVPKDKLQATEVDWAGFVPANEINKRIAPVMSSIIKHVNMNVNEDLIPGGLADKHTPETLAKLHSVSVDVINKQIKKGMEVEREHVGNNADMAREIAMDHIVEMPDYYDQLAKIEPAHEAFTLHSLNEWVSLNEKYLSYDDFEKSKWGTPEEMMNDVQVTLRNSMLGTTVEIKSITDESTDKGIKFVIKLSTGDTVNAYKTSNWRGEYEWFLNKKKINKQDIQKFALSQMKPLEVYVYYLKGHDFFHQYADDHRAWKSGESSSKRLVDLYSKLSAGDKKKAIKEYIKYAPKGTETPDIKTFKGA